MKKGYSIIGFIFIAGLGSLLHFFYEWSGNNLIVGVLSAVNESTWEHLKLFYWPFVLFAGFEYIKYGKDICDFFCIKLKSLLLSFGFIVVFFYTYQGIIGFNIDALNIADFIIAVAIGRIYERNANQSNSCTKTGRLICLSSIIAIGILFVVFTFVPPHIGLFRDPQSLTYGIPKK